MSYFLILTAILLLSVILGLSHFVESKFICKFIMIMILFFLIFDRSVSTPYHFTLTLLRSTFLEFNIINFMNFYSYFQIMTSGFFAGVCTTAIMAPGERIKCILQVKK